MLTGLGVAWTVIARQSQSAAPLQFTAGPIATALAVSILCYDGIFKRTVMGPLFMGGCRFFNIMLGLSVVQDAGLFQTQAPWVIAGGIGLYVMGITWFARHETVESPRSVLFAGLLLMVIGVALLTLLPTRGGLPPQRIRLALNNAWIWPLLLWLLTAPVWRGVVQALMKPSPGQVQLVIKQALLALIVLDAAIALLVAGPIYGVALLALMFPAALTCSRHSRHLNRRTADWQFVPGEFGTRLGRKLDDFHPCRSQKKNARPRQAAERFEREM